MPLGVRLRCAIARTRAAEGAYGTTVSSFASLSLNPLLVTVSINPSSSLLGTTYRWGFRGQRWRVISNRWRSISPCRTMPSRMVFRQCRP